MGKHDFLSPKAIGNRIKAKGLSKLRWYCQLCQKQCRDENGFKCHQTSESHRRQMEVFGMDPTRVVEGYSEMFEEDFMDHLKRAHPQSRVSAKVVYNEFIASRDHIHMNSTRWYTLTEFVKYLGKEGKCKVEETPKGWFITLISLDPAKEIADGRRAKRSEVERQEEDKHMAALYEQIERARQARIAAGIEDEGDGESEEEDEEARALQRDENEGPITLSLAAGPGPSSAVLAGAGAGAARSAALTPAAAAAVFDMDEEDGRAAGAGGKGSKRSAMDEIMAREKEAKARKLAVSAPGPAGSSGRVDAWLFPGIVVKIMAQELKEAGYYKAKGIVERVVDRFIGEVCILDTGDVVRVDQEQLETVLPKPGGKVRVVNAKYRGASAELLEIDERSFKATVLLLDGPAKGAELQYDYEDICKLAKQ